MASCRFSHGLEWVDFQPYRELRRPITRVAAEHFVRAGIDQHGQSFAAELLDAVGSWTGGADDELMFEAAVRAIVDGSLVLVLDAKVPRTLDEPKSTWLTDLIVDPLGPVLTDTGFIDIQLVHGSGAPIPGERYVIRPPVDDDLTGRLDANGEAHHTRIAKRDCRVSFPDIDKGDWGPQQQARVADEAAFIDVVVRDEDKQPVAGATWEIELQGGETRSGVTDATGRIFVPELEFLGIGRLVVAPADP